MNGLLLCLLASWAVAKAQNIYEGCGSEKKCLGFEKGLDDVQTTCLASQVIYARPLQCMVFHQLVDRHPCAVLPTENWLASSMKHIQGCLRML